MPLYFSIAAAGVAIHVCGKCGRMGGNLEHFCVADGQFTETSQSER